MTFTKVELRDIKATNWDDMLYIRKYRMMGFSYNQIARIMNITPQVVGRKWLRIKDLSKKDLERMRTIANETAS